MPVNGPFDTASIILPENKAKQLMKDGHFELWTSMFYSTLWKFPVSPLTMPQTDRT